MPSRRASPTLALVPLETFLVGAWVSLTVTAWLARREVLRTFAADHDAALRFDARLSFQVGLAEALLGAFLVLLVLRRRAHGADLLLPFAAFTLALTFLLYVHPETARLVAAGRQDGVSAFLGLAYVLELAKVLVLLLAFVTRFRRPAVKRR